MDRLSHPSGFNSRLFFHVNHVLGLEVSKSSGLPLPGSGESDIPGEAGIRRDIRVEAGHHTHGTELDASLRTELLGCVVASQLLENTTVAVEMGSGSEVYEVSAGSIHQENGGTSPALTRDGLTHSPSNDFSLAVER
jgi:hypothetical protein